MNSDMVNFTRNVDYLRKQRKWTLERTSEEADIPFSTLRTILYGSVDTIMLSTATKISNAFGIPLSEMLTEQRGGR